MTIEDKAKLAELAFEAIAKIVQSVRDAHAGKVTPSEAVAKIGELQNTIAANDTAADHALAERFPANEEPGK